MADSDTTPIPPHIAAMFPPIDWSASHVGRSVWEAWNRLNSAIFALRCAQIPELPDRLAAVDKAQGEMADALRRRDQGAK